jgi:CRISP-associated protein Cas1
LKLDLTPHKHRIPYLCISRCIVSVKGFSLILSDADGKCEIPLERYSALLVEPGCNITHEAVKLCSELNVFLFWVGEDGVRLYSAGSPAGSALTSNRLIKQVLMVNDADSRHQAAVRLYRLMFENEELPSFSTIDQLRGLEGVRVRKIYNKIATDFSIQWTSKDKAPIDLQKSINMANSCLYSLCEVAIILCGYSPAIGVVHSGNVKSLVYDLSDTIKFSEITPVAFKAYIDCPSTENILSFVRRKVRDHAKNNKLLLKLLDNIKIIMDD